MYKYVWRCQMSWFDWAHLRLSLVDGASPFFGADIKAVCLLLSERLRGRMTFTRKTVICFVFFLTHCRYQLKNAEVRNELFISIATKGRKRQTAKQQRATSLLFMRDFLKPVKCQINKNITPHYLQSSGRLLNGSCFVTFITFHSGKSQGVFSGFFALGIYFSK